MKNVSVVKRLKTYQIDIFGLKDGTYEFDFNFNDTFFAEFENSLVNKGEGTCKVLMKKTDSMITLELTVLGAIELECDRSLASFDYPINVSRTIMYKYGNKEKELSEDVFMISKTTQGIRVGSFLYEIINLAVPMKKLHPKFQDEGKDDEMIFSSAFEKAVSVDPRWETLKKLNKQ